MVHRRGAAAVAVAVGGVDDPVVVVILAVPGRGGTFVFVMNVFLW